MKRAKVAVEVDVQLPLAKGCTGLDGWPID
jgi:hypothetical protein